MLVASLLSNIVCVRVAWAVYACHFQFAAAVLEAYSSQSTSVLFYSALCDLSAVKTVLFLLTMTFCCIVSTLIVIGVGKK